MQEGRIVTVLAIKTGVTLPKDRLETGTGDGSAVMDKVDCQNSTERRALGKERGKEGQDQRGEDFNLGNDKGFFEKRLIQF